MFWNLQTYNREHVFETIYTNSCITSMIELPNNRIALSSESPSAIIIFDLNDYSIIKGVIDKDYITNYSSLCLLDESSFLYIYNEKVVQISTIDYSILFKTKHKGLNGLNAIINIEGGKYILIENGLFGFTVVTPTFIWEMTI